MICASAGRRRCAPPTPISRARPTKRFADSEANSTDLNVILYRPLTPWRETTTRLPKARPASAACKPIASIIRHAPTPNPCGEGHFTLASTDFAERRNTNVASQARPRLSVVVPIGIIVAIAIFCVIVAVLGSAQRADEVALSTERQLFTRALSNYSNRVLREVESVATSESAYRKIRGDLDPDWIKVYVG